ncbi:MAG: SGNH/GDSL hydrolase family protein [Pseudomonadota bacterium]
MIAADTLVKLALGPLFAVQGARLRRDALILPEPPGPRSGQRGHGTPMRLLILGDSSAAGVGALSQEAALSGQLTLALGQHLALDWQLWAATGATTRSTLASLDIRPAIPFDTAVVALGVNDVTQGLSLRLWMRRQRLLFETLRRRHGVRAIFVTAMPPIGLFPLLPEPLRGVLGAQAARYDAALATHCAATPDLVRFELNLPDDPDFMAHDGFHPGPRAYRAWGEQLGALMIRELLARGLP